MQDHYMVSDSGDLYDTRQPNWSAKPLRKGFSHTYHVIDNVAQFKATLRAGKYAWPGGYPLFLICDDGAALCFDCARKEARNIMDSIKNKYRDDWLRIVDCDRLRIVDCDINYENNSLYCDHCSQQIESAYGEDETSC